jgi:hypothetical protein
MGEQLETPKIQHTQAATLAEHCVASRTQPRADTRTHQLQIHHKGTHVTVVTAVPASLNSETGAPA